MHGLGSPSLILLPGLADFRVNTIFIGRDSPLRSSTIFSCKDRWPTEGRRRLRLIVADETGGGFGSDVEHAGRGVGGGAAQEGVTPE